ncbi:MAG: excinuclease subunit [Pseudomonadota bacterium]
MFVDCQGLKSPGTQGHDVLVEIAWSICDSATSRQLSVFNSILRPCELLARRDLRRVSQLCGISSSELAMGMGESEVAQEFRLAIKGFEPEAIVVHFAAFERPFLERLWRFYCEGEPLPVPLICTRDLARELLPHLGAYSLKAVAGFFGAPPDALKRAGAHLEATRIIWDGLERLRDHAEVARAARPGEALRSQRLGLPSQPGTYRFFDAADRLLYVGKATSLNDRVNSYFRGGVRNDPRKREMMAQVKRLEVATAPTPLHAAIDEFRTITANTPPYNLMMNREDGPLFWLDRTTLEPVSALRQEAGRLIGPFTSPDAFIDLRFLAAQSPSEYLFRWPVAQEVFQEGLSRALAVLDLPVEDSRAARAWLQAGVSAARSKMPFQAFGEIEEPETAAGVDGSFVEVEECVDPEKVKRSILRKVKRAAERWFNAIAINKLAGAELVLGGEGFAQCPADCVKLKLPLQIQSRHALQELAIARNELKADPRWASRIDNRESMQVRLASGFLLRRDQRSLTSRIVLGGGNLDPL